MESNKEFEPGFYADHKMFLRPRDIPRTEAAARRLQEEYEILMKRRSTREVEAALSTPYRRGKTEAK